jgi:hypothetical protein
MLGGYFMVYVITPHVLELHLTYSLNRLLLQLWPAGVFVLATVPVSMSAARTDTNAERGRAKLMAI